MAVGVCQSDQVLSAIGLGMTEAVVPTTPPSLNNGWCRVGVWFAEREVSHSGALG